MQKLTITIGVILLSVFKLSAQSDTEKDYFKKEIKDTVKNESVVIVRDFEEYKFSKHNQFDYKVDVVLRTQYKLKDAYAVESFSTLSKSNGLRTIIITQIKPNGTIKEIYLNEDKEYKDERPDYNIKLNEGTDKIAVEDLEIGDIIDYRYGYTYTTTVQPYVSKQLKNGRVYGTSTFIKNYNNFRKLLDNTEFLQQRYPTISSMFIVETPKELNLLQKSINCDYKFKESAEGDSKLFICNVGYIKAYKNEVFSYSYVDLPVIKYCLTNTANAQMQNLYPFQFTSENVSNDDIANLGKAFYNNPKFMQKYLYYTNTRQYSEGYEEVSLSKFFSVFIKTFAKGNKDKLDVLNKFHDYLSNNDEINGWQFGKMNFAVLMAKFCDKIQQPYKMMACLHRYDGPWADVIHPSEINWGIYIENGDNPLFISSTSGTTNIYEKQGSLTGTEVILFNPKDKLQYSTVTYPSISYKDNKVIYDCELSFVDDEKNYDYHFVNNYTYTGWQKQNIDDNIASKFYPEDLSTNAGFWGIVDYRLYNDEIYKDTGDFLPEFRRIRSSYEERRTKNTLNNCQSFLYSEYHFSKINVDSFRVIEGESYADNNESACKFKVEFNAENVIEKTENGMLILKLGRLLTEQLEISNFKNDERLTNFNNSNLRELDWNIELEIPEGYTPLNIQDFNQSFENAAGIFKSVVTQKGNKLIVKVEKIYKTNFLPKERWGEFITFVKQAVLFYEMKLLLEKK